VAISCEAIQELLAEHSGEVARLTDEARRHVELCPQCCEAAAGERALARIFALALPPADPQLEARVLAAIGPARRRRRVLALLPVAASLFVALLGLVLLGGLPGGSLLALLPMWSSQGWVSLAASMSDWGSALTATAGAATALVGPGAVIIAAVLSVIGIGTVVVAARRWQRISPWSDDR
jgi:hypothetical protein